ncbi:recombinase RecA [Burkholderia sp. Nafp2/4-1b]|uniref:recombinase RecA n=1 Tax=Burkholderia sp. Nafp2/4-1b TaxID=2116686 RepID=UPI0013CEEADC|nr:recombinase RecA [Burkholderia sp. Nafp2/4-1b]
MTELDGLRRPPPADFAAPKWDEGGRAHNWHNYASEDLIDILASLPLRARAIIAVSLDSVASNEEWE